MPLLSRAYALIFMVRRPPRTASLAYFCGQGGVTITRCFLPSCPTLPLHLPPLVSLAADPFFCMLPPLPPQGRSMMAMYESFDAARARGDFAVLPELVRGGGGRSGAHGKQTARCVHAHIVCSRFMAGHLLAAPSVALPTPPVARQTSPASPRSTRCLRASRRCAPTLRPAASRHAGAPAAATATCWPRACPPCSTPMCRWVWKTAAAAAAAALFEAAALRCCLHTRYAAPTACQGVSAAMIALPPQPAHPLTPAPLLPTQPTPWQNVTWEGENSVMYLQTARYLIKSALAVQAGKPLTGSAAYLATAAQQVRRAEGVRAIKGKQQSSPAGAPIASCCIIVPTCPPTPCLPQAGVKCAVATPGDWRTSSNALAGLTRVAAQLTAQAAQVLLRAAGGRAAFDGDAWNASTVDLIRAAKVGWWGGWALRKCRVVGCHQLAGLGLASSRVPLSAAPFPLVALLNHSAPLLPPPAPRPTLRCTCTKTLWTAWRRRRGSAPSPPPWLPRCAAWWHCTAWCCCWRPRETCWRVATALVRGGAGGGAGWVGGEL